MNVVSSVWVRAVAIAECLAASGLRTLLIDERLCDEIVSRAEYTRSAETATAIQEVAAV
jgi:hypothetical protein